MTSNPPDRRDGRGQILAEFAARSRDRQRRMHLDRAAAEALDAFARAGVDVLLLKGAVLAHVLYGPHRERNYFDIDLLAAPGSWLAAGEALSRLGYRNVTNDRGIQDVAGVVHADLWTRLDEFGNISIDLHWKLAGCRTTAEAVWSALRLGAQEVVIGGRAALAPGDAALALHAALHLAQHGASDAKAVSDLKLALSRFPVAEWRRAAALAADLDALDAFSAGLRLLPEGTALAKSLGLSDGTGVLWELENRDRRPRGTFHVQAISEAGTFAQRISIVRGAVFPSPNWIRSEMPWASHGRILLLVGYFTHVARTPAWAMRALRFTQQRPR